MNAAAALREPEQLGFLPAVNEPPLPRLSVVGALERHGEIHISTDGRIHLVVRVMQPKGSLPFVTMWHVGADERHAMEQLAAQLVAGAPVLIRGAGLQVDVDHGTEVLRIRRCDSVSRVEFDRARLEASS